MAQLTCKFPFFKTGNSLSPCLTKMTKKSFTLISVMNLKRSFRQMIRALPSAKGKPSVSKVKKLFDDNKELMERLKIE